MSYVVDILSAEIPASYKEALLVRDALAEARDVRLDDGGDARFEEASAEMRELHRRLTARYPCITEDPDGVWADGPLINNFGQRVATLAISFSRVGDALPFLIATATEMGFWVLDAQDEAVHLPGGAILRANASLERGRSARPWWRFWS